LSLFWFGFSSSKISRVEIFYVQKRNFKIVMRRKERGRIIGSLSLINKFNETKRKERRYITSIA